MGCETKLSVVVNLDKSQVTWADSYISSALKEDVPVLDSPNSDYSQRLFLGDDISRSYLQQGEANLYFLAASSIYPSDFNITELIDKEINNIKDTDGTLLVSFSEKEKLALPEINQKKLVVTGFPIPIRNLTEIGKVFNNRNPKKICFIGQNRPIKNPEFELELAKLLTQKGYHCSHFFPDPNPNKENLLSIGVKVYENLRGEDYWSEIATNSFFIATSFYESLSVSGIEATALGCIPIVPDVGGFKDWCPPHLRYRAYCLSEIFDMLNNSKNSSINLNFYDSFEYFNRVKKISQDIANEKD